MIKYMITITILISSFSIYASGENDGGIERHKGPRFLTKHGINYHKFKRHNFRAMRKNYRHGGCNGAH